MTRGLAARVAAVFLALRAVTAVIILFAVDDQVPVDSWTGPSVDYFDMTVLWDGSWYRTVAEHGYPQVLPLDHERPPVAEPVGVLPALPLASRGLMGLTGLGFPVVASMRAGVWARGGAAHGRAADRPGGLPGRAGHGGGVGGVPAAVSLQLAYTESLAMLVLCGFLWAVIRRRWAVTAALALVLGLTRPSRCTARGGGRGALRPLAGRAEQPVARGEYAAGAGAIVACGVSGWSGRRSPGR